jgi:hypothetical protein
LGKIELELDQLLGYGGPDQRQASKIGSAKIGTKSCVASANEKDLLAKEVAATTA